ncbi:MAG: hypothetical protein M3P30_08060 [Chloroflexota bacterium]|nr:hypothetical protein [Chloroflexota bacterium]
MAAFSVDQGLWLGHRRVAQKDADAAARAGAAEYIQPLANGDPIAPVFPVASDAALSMAQRNGAPTPTTSSVSFTPGCDYATATTCARRDCPLPNGNTVIGAPSIEIAVRRPAPPLFLSAFGVANAKDIGATSTACVGAVKELGPGPTELLPLMVHYGDPNDPSSGTCFLGVVPYLGQRCILDSQTSILYPPAAGYCEDENSNVSASTVNSYLETGLTGISFKCDINSCTVDPVTLLCPSSACTPANDTDCIREKTGTLGAPEIQAFSNRLINGETQSNSCWLKSSGNDALAAFKAAFNRADGQPVGGPPGLGGTDTGDPIYVKKGCVTGRIVFVFITEKYHGNGGNKEYPVLAFAFVYLADCYKASTGPPPQGDINWCQDNGPGSSYLQGLPLRLVLDGQSAGDITPIDDHSPLIIQTTR